MRTLHIRNSTKRGLVYLSVLLLYVVVFSNILLKEKPAQHLHLSVKTAPVPG